MKYDKADKEVVSELERKEGVLHQEILVQGEVLPVEKQVEHQEEEPQVVVEDVVGVFG